MINLLKLTFRTLLACCLLLTLLVCFSYYVLETDAGLRFTFNMISRVIPGQLHYQNLQGHLADHVSVQDLTYNNDQTHLDIHDLVLSWDLSNLRNQIVIKQAKANDIILQTSNKNQDQDISWKWLSYLKVQHLQINNLQYNHNKISKILFDDHHFSLLSDTINISGNYKLSFIPDIQLQVSAIVNGTVQDHLINGNANINYQNGILKINDTKLTIANTTSDIAGTVTDKWNIHWNIAIPNLQNLSSSLTGSIESTGAISGDRNHPQISGNFIGTNFDDVKKIQTDFIANVEFDKDFSKPKINLDLHNANVSIPKLNINISPIHLNGTIENNGKINFNGTFAVDNKTGNISGTYDLNHLVLNTNITAEDLPISKLQNYTITATPNIQLSYEPNHLTIKGKIDIPSAELTPNDFNDVTTLPNELEIISDQPSDDLPTKMSLQLQVNLGQNINLTYDKLTTKLGGSVTIIQTPHTVPIANGELFTKNGIYNLFDRKLKIESGRIIYTGNALLNPGIDIRAVKDIKASVVTSAPSRVLIPTYSTQNIQVGIAVRGTLKKPVISYFSDDDLSQEDIMSYLIFGYPRNQVNETSEISLLNAVALNTLSSSGGSNMGLKALTKIPNQIQSKLGLSELGFGSTDNFNPKTGELTSNIPTFNVGKQIGDKLYVHYSVGIQDSSVQVFNLRYQLNKHLSIQSESSPLENGADLVYVLEK